MTMTDNDQVVIKSSLEPSSDVSVNPYGPYKTLIRKYFPILAQIENVRSYRSLKSDVLSAAQITVLKYALTPEKLAKASFLQLIQGFEILNKSERLNSNLSTDNVANAHFGQISLKLPTDG